MHIVFFTHYFPPEGNAPATRTYDHCIRWVRAGNQVTVITCAPNVPTGKVYEGYRNRLWPQVSEVDGIKVVRVWTVIAANKGTFWRIINFVSYMFSAIFGYLFACRRPDVIIATSPQFFCGWAGVFAKWISWRPLIVEIRDIWPESIVTVGAVKKGLAIRILEWLEKRLYLAADQIVAVGNGYKENIEGKVKPKRPVQVITNGIDAKAFSPEAKSPSFAERFQVNDKFVCAYIGTIGMAHALEVTIRAAKRLLAAGRNDIRFLLVGDGARRESLEEMAKQEGVDKVVRFTGLLDKSQMRTVLASSDCLLVHLKKSDLFETVIPSKIFETMAMERPIIMGVRGESAEIVRASGSGLEIEPENDEELAHAVCKLADDHAYYDSLCKSGRAFVMANYDRDQLAGRFLEIIESTSKVILRKTPASTAEASEAVVVDRRASSTL